MPRIHRPPRRTFRDFPQWHSRFLGSLVGLAFVAFDARQNTVFPVGSPSSRTGLHMVNRQFFGPRLGVAVLARKAIPPVNIAATECHDMCRHPIIMRQGDDFRNSHSKGHGLNKQLVLGGNEPSPIAPCVLLKIGRIDKPSPLRGNQRQRPRNGDNSNRLPVSIQNQGWALQ